MELPMEGILTEPNAVLTEAANVLKRAIVHAFTTMAGMEAEVGETYPDRPTRVSGRNVAGFIGWVGNWNGTGVLECTPEFACKLANILLGTEDSNLSEDALDAIAEMTNIIFGEMKTELESGLGTMGLSTPTVVYGNDVGMRSTGDPFMVVPVRIEEAELRVKLYMVRVEEKRNPLSHFWAASNCGAL
jgi:chemotaxis protein CheX